MSLGAVTIVFFIAFMLPGVPAVRADRHNHIQSLKEGENQIQEISEPLTFAFISEGKNIVQKG